jgi:hypothetical protein
VLGGRSVVLAVGQAEALFPDDFALVSDRDGDRRHVVLNDRFVDALPHRLKRIVVGCRRD